MRTRQRAARGRQHPITTAGWLVAAVVCVVCLMPPAAAGFGVFGKRRPAQPAAPPTPPLAPVVPAMPAPVAAPAPPPVPPQAASAPPHVQPSVAAQAPVVPAAGGATPATSHAVPPAPAAVAHQVHGNGGVAAVEQVMDTSFMRTGTNLDRPPPPPTGARAGSGVVEALDPTTVVRPPKPQTSHSHHGDNHASRTEAAAVEVRDAGRDYASAASERAAAIATQQLAKPNLEQSYEAITVEEGRYAEWAKLSSRDFPSHSETDEAKWPIGKPGFHFYHVILEEAFHKRGVPWPIWYAAHADDYDTVYEAAQEFFELANPDMSMLVAATRSVQQYWKKHFPTIEVQSDPKLYPQNIHALGTPTRLSGMKLVHDRDQMLHLLEQGVLPYPFLHAVDNFTSVVNELLAKYDDVSKMQRYFPMPGEEAARTLGRTIQRFLYMPPDPPPRLLPEPLRYPLNLNHNWAAIEDRYFSMDPGIVVLDDFLTPEAVENLRELCLSSTSFFDVKNKYVGAYVFTGFGNHVIFRLVQELRRVLPNLIGDKIIRNIWSYKYGESDAGIGIHSDEADVNINFWLSLDDANLDPDTGGLVVYRAQPPANWTFEDYNQQPQAFENLRRLVDESSDGAVRVPHKQNRIVIFNSTLAHESDKFTFKKGYKNRRINLTLLFGNRYYQQPEDQELAQGQGQQPSATQTRPASPSTRM